MQTKGGFQIDIFLLVTYWSSSGLYCPDLLHFLFHLTNNNLSTITCLYGHILIIRNLKILKPYLHLDRNCWKQRKYAIEKRSHISTNYSWTILLTYMTFDCFYKNRTLIWEPRVKCGELMRELLSFQWVSVGFGVFWHYTKWLTFLLYKGPFIW